MASALVVRLTHLPSPVRALATGVSVVVLAAAPLAQLATNWRVNDASRRFFVRDFAANALEELPPNAIYFTVGDNDTFPVMYLQTVEGVRPDVQILNTSLANASWYIDQIRRRDSAFPVSAVARRDSIATDSVTIPAPGPDAALGLQPGDSAFPPLRVLPTPMFRATKMLPADWVLVDIVVRNAWRRPLAISITAGDRNLGWLSDYARLDGLYWRIVPATSPPVDRDRLRASLIDRRSYRGYADSTVRLEDVTRTMGALSYVAAAKLFDADRSANDLARCRDTRAKLEAKLPPSRLELWTELSSEIGAGCDPR